MKHVSYDNDFELEFDFLGKKTCFSSVEAENIKVSQYFLCNYDSLYWTDSL